MAWIKAKWWAFKNLGKRINFNDVESVDSLRKRFGSGSMSHGALSAEAHETLAIAMNRIGAASCSGEGGEDKKRYADIISTLKQNGLKWCFFIHF